MKSLRAPVLIPILLFVLEPACANEIASIEPKGMLRFMEAMIKGTIERDLPGTLESLRDHLEREA